MKLFVVGIGTLLGIGAIALVLVWASSTGVLDFLQGYVELLKPYTWVLSVLLFFGYVLLHLDVKQNGRQQREDAKRLAEMQSHHASRLEQMRLSNEKALHELEADLARRKELDTQMRAALARHYANVSALCRAKLSLLHAADRARALTAQQDRNLGWKQVGKLASDLKKARDKMKNAMYDLLFIPPEVTHETGELDELMKREDATPAEVVQSTNRIRALIRRLTGVAETEVANSLGERSKLRTSVLALPAENSLSVQD